jgi:hypothetical protein
MLQAIEEEVVISPDGKLPEAFRPAFGHKARIVVLIVDETVEAASPDSKRYQTLAVQDRIIPARDVIHER